MKRYSYLLLLLLCINVHAQDRAAWLQKAKFGVMTHYLPDWLRQTENLKIDVAKWNELIDYFDVNALQTRLKV